MSFAQLQELVETPLVSAGIVPSGFVDSYALNLYHDGRCGRVAHISHYTLDSQV